MFLSNFEICYYFVSMKKIYLLAVLLLIFIIPVFGQETDIHEHEHHNYHIGIGFAGTHISGEQGIAPGFHLHFLRQVGESRNWGLGLGFETLKKENLHNSVNFLANYHPFQFLSLNAGPGLVFEKHDNKTEISPAFHTEAVLEFDLNEIHIGPMVGFGFDKEDTHFSLGIHVGFGF